MKTFTKKKLDPLVQSLIALQKQRQLFPTGKCTVVVGVSGGVDSICLLHLLAELSQLGPYTIDLHVAHLDHALRPESAHDARFVQEFATTLGLPCTIETLATGQLANEARTAKRGIEAAARTARYSFFERVATNLTPAGQLPLVAVAHNADDQAETVLMNFIRGSGIDGLGGMRWISPLPVAIDSAVQVVRPLLDAPRAEIEAYLARHNLRWKEDGTNSDTKFLRNRIRHELLPILKEINPDLLHTVGRTADIMRAEASRLHGVDTQTLSDVTLPESESASRILLDLAKLQALDIAAMRSTLRLALQQICNESRDIQFSIIESLVQVVQSTVDKVIASGPNTLVGDLCWTLLPAGPRGTAALSLHQSNQLPYAVNHPLVDHPLVDHLLLDETWQGEPTLAASPQNGWVLHSRTIPRSELPADWQADDPWCAYLDKESIRAPQLCTPADAAPKFAPLGLGGKHKSIGDLFTDRKISPALRSRWPLIVDAENGNVLWVCGLQIAHEPRITQQTEQVLHLWWAKS